MSFMKALAERPDDPTALQRVIYTEIEKRTGEDFDLVDVTNPFVLLMEMGAALSASAVRESTGTLPRLYSYLAESRTDLYRHMSDDDYKDTFAIPAIHWFHFSVNVSSFDNYSVWDPIEQCHKVVFPRGTTVKVKDLTFTLENPVVIGKYQNQGFVVSYDVSVVAEFSSVKSIYIPSSVRNDTGGSSWLIFSVPLNQMGITTSHHSVTQSEVFSAILMVENNFAAARVWQRRDGLTWLPLKTTHSDYVYDAATPTALLLQSDTVLTVEIPYVYVDNGAVDGEVRIDIYSTNGVVKEDLSKTPIDEYRITYDTIDDVRDSSVYTAAAPLLSVICFAEPQLEGGRDPLSFEKIKQRVVDVVNGLKATPLTSAELTTVLADKGFSTALHVDHITDRIYLTTKPLPRQLSTTLMAGKNESFVSRANCCTYPLLFRMSELTASPYILVNAKSTTLLEKNVYTMVNGLLKWLPYEEVQRLKNLPLLEAEEHFNTHSYYYSPFSYVFDGNDGRFDVRTYNLQKPTIAERTLNYVNGKVTLSVYTEEISIVRTDYGYRILLLTGSQALWKKHSDRLKQVLLRYTANGDTVSIEGTLLQMMENGESVYVFDLNTRWDIDADDTLLFSNFNYNGNIVSQRLGLSDTISVVYRYRESIYNSAWNTVTEEGATVQFGSRMQYLWNNHQSYLDDESYDKYTDDVWQTYGEPVYDVDPVTNSRVNLVNGVIQYTELHPKGTLMLDKDNRRIVKYSKGERIRNVDGTLKPYNVVKVLHQAEIMLVDAAHMFATDSASEAYRELISSTIDQWVSGTLETITGKLLEQTKLFYRPTTTAGYIQILNTNGEKESVKATVVPKVVFYVDDYTKRNPDIQRYVEQSTKDYIATYLGNSTISMSELTSGLKTLHGSAIVDVSVDLGLPTPIVHIPDNSQRFGIAKTMVSTDNGLLTVEDSFVFEFKLFTVK